MTDNSLYDLIIIGGGPAGLAAAIYAGRARMQVLLLEKGNTGGQAATTEEVENYPGIPHATGPDLMKQFRAHAEQFGTAIRKGDVRELELDGDVKVVRTRKGEEFRARSVVLAMGADPRPLGSRGEGAFRGKGVSYCATCDADFFTDLDVLVVGSGDTAVEEAIYLTRFVNSLTLICIHDVGIMDANRAAQERLAQNDKIRVIWNSTVAEIKGDGLVTGVTLRNVRTGELTDLPADGVFIFVGYVPRTEFVQGRVDRDSSGYILADPDTLETSVPGVFAAGDCRRKWLRQVVTAAADGAIAATAAERYLTEEEHFRAEVLAPAEPVALVFWSPTVPASLELLGRLEQRQAESGGAWRLARVDLYKNQRVARRFGVTAAPTLVWLRHGQVVQTLEGDAALTAADVGFVHEEV